MDFFGHQDLARRKTRQLVGLFALAVAAIVATIYTLVRLAIAERGGWVEPGSPFFDFTLAGRVTFLTLGIIVIGSLFKTFSLRQGGRAIAVALGGRELAPDAAEAGERRLLNVVEEMAIAAGMPVPTVFLLDGEESINAFAAGFSPDEAVIGVTRGAVDQLGRDQLQGVIAHEFSHIVNGDMRLNLRLVGLVHGILVIAMIGYEMLRWGGRDRRSALPFAAGGLTLIAVGGIGVFFARLIKAALSRQREFLADASAVQFTRNPAGLSGALEKIAKGSSKIGSSHAEEASHFFFAQGLSSFFAMLSTHPPLSERIRRIDPANDRVVTLAIGPQPGLAEALVEGFSQLPLSGEKPLPQMRVDPEQARAPARRDALGGSPRPGQAAAALVAAVGRLEERHVDYARELLARLPEELIAAVREPLAAQAVVLGLLVDRDPEVRRRQSERLAAAPKELLGEIPRLLPKVLASPPEARLPLLDLAMPALARLSPAQYAAFAKLVEELVQADQRQGLFELALQRALLRHLGRRFDPSASLRPPQIFALGKLEKEISLLLSAVAHASSADPMLSFESGAAQLRGLAKLDLALLPADYCGLEAVDPALRRLDELTPRMKKPLLAACAAAVAADRRVSIEEAELLRVIADTLGCPVPPLLAGQEAAA